METVQIGAVSLLLLSVLYRHFLLTAHCLPPSHGHNPLRLCCLPHRIHILREFLDDYWNIHVLMAQLCWYYFIILILAWICISIKAFHLMCQLIALFYSFIKGLISVTSVISRSFRFFKRFIYFILCSVTISYIYGCIPHGYLETEKDRRGRQSFIDLEWPWLYTGLWMLGAKSGSCRAASDLNCGAISPAWESFAWSQILSPEESSHIPLRTDYTCSKFTLSFIVNNISLKFGGFFLISSVSY